MLLFQFCCQADTVCKDKIPALKFSKRFKVFNAVAIEEYLFIGGIVSINR